jgi:heme exporter protein D
MKQNWFKNGIWPCKLRTRLSKVGLAMSIVTVLALILLSAPSVFAKKAVLEKVKEQTQKGQMKLEATVTTTVDRQPIVQLNPVKPKQTEVLPASAVKDKGKQIKWQVVSSGANCGTGSITYQLRWQDGCELCGTVGQLAAGPGSSPSYGMNSGFWQKVLQGYIRGDANVDGVINIADVVYLINYLFANGTAPDPLWVGDANCDDLVNIADVVYLINYLFTGGSPPSC